MNRRSTWIHILTSFCAVVAMALVTLTSAANAAGTNRTAHGTQASKASKACPKPKGTIKYSDWQFPDTLNVYQTSENVSSRTIDGLLDGTVFFNEHLKLFPVLLTQVPTVANKGITNGGKTITVHFKHGLKWSNGKEITSADLKFGWRIEMDSKSGPYCAGTCDVFSRIDTPNKYTAVLHTKTVYAPVISIALPAITPWPTQWANGWAKNDVTAAVDKFFNQPTYNFEDASYPTDGPYQVSSYVKDNRIVLKPMKYYHTLTCGPKLAQVIFAFYADKPGLIAAAASSETDVTANYLPADLPELQKHKTVYHLHIDPGLSWEHLELNTDSTYNGKPNPLSSQKVRVALALAMDKLGLIQSALGIPASAAKEIISWSMWTNTKKIKQPYAYTKLVGQWDPLQKKFDTNVGKGKALADAKKLLSQTNFKGGFTLDTYTTKGNPVRAAQLAVLQKNWARIGVTLNTNFVPASKLFGPWDQGGILYRGTFQIAQFTNSIGVDPEGWSHYFLPQYIDRRLTTHSNINNNQTGMDNPLVTTNMIKAAHTVDPKKRAQYYKTVQIEMNKQAYWIMEYFRGSITTEDGHVTNIKDNPYVDTQPEWNMWSWGKK